MRYFLHIASCLAVGFLSGCQAIGQTLPSDVTGVDTDMRVFEDLYGRLQKIPPKDKDAFLWLSDNTHALPPLFRYEFARRQNVIGERDVALHLLAQARLARDVDAAECAKNDRTTPGYVWMTITNSLETGILNSPSYDKQAWLKAIDVALKLEPKRRRTSALWLCGPNNFKEPQAALDARRTAFEFMKRDFERMKSELRKDDR
jgi:hypothetical protein